MRFSKAFIPTRKEDPADAEIPSHKLLVRAGFIRMVTRGIYSYLPLAWRSIKKIEKIVREEMDRSGAQEVFLPAVQPSELWKESDRWENYGDELLRFEDRKGSEFCFGPTHEEVITDLVRKEISSYKQLPMNLYQIQTKFRDEPRPRFGLMRGREFVMKDAYSFDLDEEAANESYEKMFEAYQKTFDRMGFDYATVEAATGNIGGSRSHEFQVLAETGGDQLVRCSECDYAANVEKAEVGPEPIPDTLPEPEEREKVDTPGQSTIDEISGFLDVEPSECLKTLIYKAGDEPVAVLIRGDRAANDLKVADAIRDYLEADGDIRLANDGEIAEITGAPVGFAGPVDLDITIIADESVKTRRNYVAGANEADTHYRNINPERDFTVDLFADLQLAESGSRCGRCDGRFETQRGIEVGHVFYLGTKYSEAMDARVQDENGENKPLIMGCYGMGITRILAAVVEQNHDENGIIWPQPIAPFDATVLPLQMRDDEVVNTANEIYEELTEMGWDVLIDDRDTGVGSKFNDADLIGIPLRITVGSRGVSSGEVEVEWRGDDEQQNVPIGRVVTRADQLLRG